MGLPSDRELAQRIPSIVASSLDPKSHDWLLVLLAHDGNGDGVLAGSKIIGQQYRIPHFGNFAGRQVGRLP